MSLPPVGVRMALVVALLAGALPAAAAAAQPGLAAGIPLNPVGDAAGPALNAGKQLLGGNPVGAAGTLASGAASAVSTATAGLALAAISASVAGAAGGVLNDTAAALGSTTSPQLRTTWFSSTYWRMAAIAAVLTLPFLFAAAVQALIRSDVALLIRAAFGYLPLAMLAIGIAAPLTMLLLAACDELCSFISSAAGNQSAHFLARIAVSAGGLAALDGSPFLAFFIGLFVIVATFALWVELLLREAAVYVIVLMLPLAFSAFVWPARRIWAIRVGRAAGRADPVEVRDRRGALARRSRGQLLRREPDRADGRHRPDRARRVLTLGADAADPAGGARVGSRGAAARRAEGGRGKGRSGAGSGARTRRRLDETRGRHAARGGRRDGQRGRVVSGRLTAGRPVAGARRRGDPRRGVGGRGACRTAKRRRADGSGDDDPPRGSVGRR